MKNLEAKALMQAVELARYHNWEDIIVESDAKNIIEMLQGKRQGMDWELENILTDIAELTTTIPRLRWNFVRRNTNKCANWIARKFRE